MSTVGYVEVVFGLLLSRQEHAKIFREAEDWDEDDWDKLLATLGLRPAPPTLRYAAHGDSVDQYHVYINESLRQETRWSQEQEDGVIRLDPATLQADPAWTDRLQQFCQAAQVQGEYIGWLVVRTVSY